MKKNKYPLLENLHTTATLTGTGKKYKPYYNFSNGLSGLGALGDMSHETEVLIAQYGNNLKEIIDAIEREINYTGTWDFDDIDALYNRGITTAQKQAWVYYKRKTLNIPMLGGWKKYYLKGSTTEPLGTTAELNELVAAGALFYHNGDYMPLAVYTWGNMYHRAEQLEQDKDYITTTFGDAVYLKHLEAVNKAKPEMIRVDDPDETRRAVILPISTLARRFYVKEVRTEYMTDVNKSEQTDFRGNRMNAKKRIDLTFDGETEYALREIFVKWMYTLNQKRFFSPGIGPFEVDNFYVHKYPMSDTYKELSPLPEFEVRKRAENDGNRLFALFLIEVITDADIARLNEEFNKKYNSWSDLNYNAVPIAFEVSREFNNGGVAIKAEKREAIAYMETVGSGILAYDVGVGKTLSALLELANALHQGKCKRPLVVVPNPTYRNWIKEAFGTTDKDTGEVFQGILSGMGYKYNDWYNLGSDLADKLNKEGAFDKIVDEGTVTFVSYEGFMKIGFSDSLRNDLVPQFISILENQNVDPVIEQKPNALPDLDLNLNGLGLTKTEVAEYAEGLGKTTRDKKKDEKGVAEMIGEALENTVCEIDLLGFDYLIIDEAHRCKKVFTNVQSDDEGNKDYTLTAGTPSKTGLLAFCHCNHIQRKYGRNVLLLTATPFTNSPLEIFSMLSLVGYDILVQYGYYNINDFFKQFANKTSEYVVTAKGTVEMRQLIKGFNNRLIMQKLIFTKVNYKTGEDVGVARPCKINLPMLKVQTELPAAVSGLGNIERKAPKPHKALDNDKQVLTYLEMNDLQRENQEYIYALANSPQAKEDPSILLRVMNASLDNAFSPYLFSMQPVPPPATADEFVENSPKIKYAMECIRSVKKYHEAKGEPCSGQVIYSNRGVDYFRLIKEYMIDNLGFKPNVMYEGKRMAEVMIIEGGTAQNDREYIKDAFNKGIVKVIIGSATIREGINLQKKGTVLYDLYPDWNPTDFIQLSGRIWRQGNEFGYVRVVMPLVEDSMDVFVFQKLEEKTARINDIFFREGKANVLEVDSFDPGEIKYALIKDVNHLVKIDFSIERENAKNALDLIAEDYEALKQLTGELESMTERRASAIESLIDDVQNVKQFITDNEREAKTDKEVKKKVEYTMNLLFDIENFLKTPTDDELLMRFALRIENYNARVSYKYTMRTSAWRLQYFVESVRLVRKKERAVLKPKGFSITDDITTVAETIKTDFEDKKAAFVSAYGASQDIKDWPQSRRWAEIYDEIVAKKERLRINGQPPEARAKEFATLNYLLDYKAGQVTPGQCQLPQPGQAPPPPLTCPPVDSTGMRRIDEEGLRLLSRCIEAEPNTKAQNTDPKTNYYTDTRLALHDSIIADVKGNKPCRVQNQPIAILTGGPPGSGKTTFLKKFAPWMGEKTKIVHIDADEIRAQLPEYKGWNAFNTQQETRDIVNRLLEDIGNPCEHDIIYDGTMNKADNYRPLIAKLRRLGYKIFVVYMQVDKKTSIDRAMSRYQRSGRYVPIEVINEVFERGLAAYEQIIKEADGYVRVDGVKQTIIEKGGMELPRERNYEFAQEMSETKVTPNKKSPLQRRDAGERRGQGDEPTPTNLTLYKYKAKAIAIKMKMGNLQGVKRNPILKGSNTAKEKAEALLEAFSPNFEYSNKSDVDFDTSASGDKTAFVYFDVSKGFYNKVDSGHWKQLQEEFQFWLNSIYTGFAGQAEVTTVDSYTQVVYSITYSQNFKR